MYRLNNENLKNKKSSNLIYEKTSKLQLFMSFVNQWAVLLGK